MLRVRGGVASSPLPDRAAHRRQAALREGRAAEVQAAQAEVADALQDELHEAQRHQEATEAKLRMLMAALARLREESAASQCTDPSYTQSQI